MLREMWMKNFGYKLVMSLLLTLLLLGQAQAGFYNSMVVLGDSLSDSGNISILTDFAIPGPSNAYSAGRFTDGLNYADYLAEALGVALVPSIAGGTNFAFGGARTDSHSDGPFDVMSQLEYLLASGIPLNKNTLVVLFAGGNNLRDGLVAAAVDPANVSQISAATIQNAVGDLMVVLQQLIAAGARDILVPNVPNLGAIPEVTALIPVFPGIDILAQTLTEQFNLALKGAIAQLDYEGIIRFDTFKFMAKLTEKPAKYNLTNVTDACYTGEPDRPDFGGEICANPNEYLYFDGHHATSATYRILATAILKKLSDDDDDDHRHKIHHN